MILILEGRSSLPIDAAGLYCPIPIVELKLGLEEACTNETVESISDDPGFKKDALEINADIIFLLQPGILSLPTQKSLLRSDQILPCIHFFLKYLPPVRFCRSWNHYNTQ